ncbi:hypothetical protein Nepgr_006805 [Nepenthes gracilis]|uniref:Transmembrane protein n=1 Tax=Nepenthes gracilis TaxID=150966 RepID=A0AAD3XHS7_NEPGR|nr:hypothetical protein Nepgr_006805 [Nepenthes gracilis]
MKQGSPKRNTTHQGNAESPDREKSQRQRRQSRTRTSRARTGGKRPPTGDQPWLAPPTEEGERSSEQHQEEYLTRFGGGSRFYCLAVLIDAALVPGSNASWGAGAMSLKWMLLLFELCMGCTRNLMLLRLVYLIVDWGCCSVVDAPSVSEGLMLSADAVKFSAALIAFWSLPRCEFLCWVFLSKLGVFAAPGAVGVLKLWPMAFFDCGSLGVFDFYSDLQNCSGTRFPAALAAVTIVLILLFFGGSDPILLDHHLPPSSGLVRDSIMVGELLCLGEVAVATLAGSLFRKRFSVELLNCWACFDEWSDVADAWGPLGLVAGQDPSVGFCCVSMQLVLVYGWCSFCPALLDVLALICLPWTIVAAVCRGCFILLATAFTNCSILPFCRYQFCCCSGWI